MKINSIFLSDSYKMAHPRMLPEGTTLIYGNCTPRSGKHAPKGIKKVVSFGQQLIVRWLKEEFDENFFNNPNAVKEIEKELTLHYGVDYDATHFKKLHNLGYLPLEFKSLPEGVEVPFGVPVMTWWNTHPDFAWLPLCLETPLSTMFWKLSTSATIALQYKRVLTKWANKTDKNNLEFVNFQGHDFSARGMSGIDATWLSGLGHVTSFLGSDTLSTIPAARHYYDEKKFITASVPASEHSVSSACIATMGELEMIRYYMLQFPTGILSIVSDTFDLWKVITEYLPQLKEEILARDGKIVIRPDSGDPVDIICGTEQSIIYNDRLNISEDIAWTYIDQGNGFPAKYVFHKGQMYSVEPSTKIPTYVHFEPVNFTSQQKGVIELLWDLFGGTINDQGYKVLDPHIGAIYGDSITIDRAEEICKRLKAKGFASTNIVLGVGSFTYQFNTRDTFGFAMKATYVEVGEPPLNGEGKEIFKNPITDDGTKKSAKGLLTVQKESDSIDEGTYKLVDQVTWKEEDEGFLQTIYREGYFFNKTTLTQIRQRLNENI